MDTLMTLADQGVVVESRHLIPIIAIVGGLLVAIVAIVSGTVFGSRKTQAREETRRELAAYVAEGSITPEDAERILKAEPED